uniref:Uncharacterized protein n=1 Tax=Prasinoderma singulare TaxID=676789 RepID=A0A7S3C123_9VIRI
MRAVQQLERCCAGHKALRRTVARRCLLNYPLWWRAPEATRLQQLDIAASSPAAAFAEAGGVGALLDVAGEGTASALMRHAEARKAVVAAVTRAVTGAMASRRDEVSALPQREDLCACLAIALDTGSTSRPPPPADLAAGAMCGIASALLRPESRPTVLGVVGGFGGAVLAGAMMRPLPSRDGSGRIIAPASTAPPKPPTTPRTVGRDSGRNRAEAMPHIAPAARSAGGGGRLVLPVSSAIARHAHKSSRCGSAETSSRLEAIAPVTARVTAATTAFRASAWRMSADAVPSPATSSSAPTPPASAKAAAGEDAAISSCCRRVASGARHHRG